MGLFCFFVEEFVATGAAAQGKVVGLNHGLDHDHDLVPIELSAHKPLAQSQCL